MLLCSRNCRSDDKKNKIISAGKMKNIPWCGRLLEVCVSGSGGLVITVMLMLSTEGVPGYEKYCREFLKTS